MTAPTSSPVVVRDGWTATVDRELALQHGAPHAVVSQVLRPDVAACLPTDAVKLRSAQDAQCCVTALFLKAGSTLLPGDVNFAAGLPHLTELDLSNSAVSLMGIASLSKLRQLKTIRLVKCKNIAPTPAPIIELPQLQHLDISSCNIPLETLHLPKIDTLVAQDKHVDATLCSQITRRFPALRYVDLDRCPSVDGDCLAEIVTLPELQRFCVGHVRDMDGAACMAQIARASTLRRLELNCCWTIEAADFEQLLKLQSLRYLSVHSSASSVVVFASIATLITLEELDAGSCHVADASLMHIAKLPELQRLSLKGTAVTYRGATCFTAAGLAHLGGMPRLRSLDLRRCSLTAEQMAAVRHVPELLVDQ